MSILAPGGISILAPGGHKNIAPAGQHTIDNSCNNSGGTDKLTFSTKFESTLKKIDIVAGLAVTFAGIQIELTGVKGSKCAASMSNEPTDNVIKGVALKLGPLKGKTVAQWIRA